MGIGWIKKKEIMDRPNFFPHKPNNSFFSSEPKKMSILCSRLKEKWVDILIAIIGATIFIIIGYYISSSMNLGSTNITTLWKV